MTVLRCIILCYTALLLASCSHRASERPLTDGDTLTSRAELLTMIDCGDYVAAIVGDPWNEGKILARYALVPRDKAGTVTVPEGFVSVTIPLGRSLVDSSTNTSAIASLGALDRIAAVADGNFYADSDTLSALIACGRITDIGNSMSPKLEALVEVSPDAILSSPYKNAGHGVLETLKVPVIECADYMEPTPLGRAEWLLLLGWLYGCSDSAKAVYTKVVNDYEALRKLVDSTDVARPLVLPELLTSGVWYVPGGQSYMARMLADAGADYPWKDDSSSGSLQLDASAVIDRASDADIWYMRVSGKPTLADLSEMSPLYSSIKAFRTGNIYNCDPSATTFFNDIAFHPERILADFIKMFHPRLLPDYELHYFTKL